MANESIQPYTGPLTFDLTAIALLLVDLAPGALRGLRREQPGIEGVISELEAGVPKLGAKAGISSDVYAEFEKKQIVIAQIREARLIFDKAAEVLAESEAYYEDQREIDITLMASAVRTAARRRDESLRAAFEKTLKYYGQIAAKAARTRRKNAKAEAEAEAPSEVEASEAAEAKETKEAKEAKEAAAPAERAAVVTPAVKS